MTFAGLTRAIAPLGRVLLLTASFGAAGMPVLAQSVSSEAGQPPGVYYSWRDLAAPAEQCLSRSQQALDTVDVGEVQLVDNSVAGRTADSTVVFVCIPDQASTTATTVMMIISSQDDQAAVDLRSALQAAF